MIVARTAAAWLRVLAVATTLVTLASADCECGYSVSPSDSETYTFTDLLETNFFTQDSIRGDKNWAIQKNAKEPGYKVGALGRKNTEKNVKNNPLKDKLDFKSGGKNGGDPGLQLWVSSEIKDDTVKTAEVKTSFSKMLYGSFRVSMKHTTVNGTCGAFFFYLSDSNEIDMEFLNRQFVNDTSAPVHLVLHSPESVLFGGDAAKTESYEKVELPFRPDHGFHEYRFDWTPEKVSFYADGQWLKDITKSVPKEAGSVLMNHWSDGRVGWSGGPPTEDAALTIGYFKAYFNSTDSKRTKEHEKRCVDPSNPKAVCEIPEDAFPDPTKDAGAANSFYFSTQQNMTHGSSKGAASGLKASSLQTILGVVLVGLIAPLV